MFLTGIQYRTLEEEFSAPKTEWVYECEDTNKWYPCIRAANDFYEAHGRYPNPEDFNEVRDLVQKVVQSFAFDEETLSGFEIESNYIEEM
jgi:hypothetical protein